MSLSKIGPDHLRERVGLTIENHGGFCCGIKCLHTFHTVTKENKKIFYELMDWWAEKYTYNKTQSIVSLQVTLTAGQVKSWEEPLFDVGFKRVASFINMNSLNKVSVYMWLPYE